MNLLTEIQGVSQTVLKIKLLSEVIRSDVMKEMKKAAILVQNRAKENLAGQHGHNRHWITGNLARGIKSEVGWESLYELVGVIGTDVEYAPFVESLPDGGFLYPALQEVKGEAFVMVREGINKTIKGKFR